ncbi:hypothetical protein ACFE04_007607 [Oxalis oulophora]
MTMLNPKHPQSPSHAAQGHILIFPYPAQGHMIPLLDLTHKLSLTKNLTITILITPKNLPLLTPLLNSSPSIQTLILPLPPHPSLPLGVENAKDCPVNLAFTALSLALADLYHPIIDWFKSHPSPPTAIISDFFLGWTEGLARALGVKRIIFSPSGALALSLVFSLWRDLPIPEEGDEDGVVPFNGVPNSPVFRFSQVSTLYRMYLAGDPTGDFIKEGFRSTMESWGLIINTFRDLENDYLDHLIGLYGENRVWAVGPILPDSSSGSNRGGSSTQPVDDVIGWLDKREVNSVVYVCFGSVAVLSNEQMEALALALEKSGVHFVWSVKEPLDCQRGMLAKVVAKAVRENCAERERAVELRKAALEAIKDNGSSGKDFEALVKHLEGLNICK